jgi:hypothetical protein
MSSIKHLADLWLQVLSASGKTIIIILLVSYAQPDSWNGLLD